MREDANPNQSEPAGGIADRSALLDCIAALEALVGDRSRLSLLSEDERKRLIMAAGRVAKPLRDEVRCLSKAIRKSRKRELRQNDRAARDSTEIRLARTAATFLPPPARDEAQQATPVMLGQARHCYVCKAEFRQLHFFYDTMCQPCAELNYQKRFEMADLRGRIVLITGARVKIGYQASLKLLRAGAEVIATTRFPRDGARRYALEPDYAEWQHRLHLFGLDLRHAPSVEVFARYIGQRFDRLDFLLNNAAQTVRRPRGFYAHLLAGEQMALAATPLLAAYQDCQNWIERSPKLPEAAGLIAYATNARGLAPGLVDSSLMSQIPLLPDDLACGQEVFPVEQLDVDEQQVDLRPNNSWRMKLAEVPTAEMLEIQFINAVAPFILCAKLKPLMLRGNTGDRHIVNVSAMEGKFSRYTKTDRHPHTNMAKAALNMLTQTSAPDYKKSGIHMNAVDTGWVTDEDPAVHAQRKRDELGFQPPLDIVDGAARIVDPIFSGLNTGEHVWGKFLKDYQPTSW